MAYRQLTKNDMDGSVVFICSKRLQELIGVPRTTLHSHIVSDQINAYRFRHRTYFKPDDVERYKKLFKSGLLGRKSRE